MKKENVSFILYLILGISLSVIGTFIIAFSTIKDLDFLYSISGILAYVFGVILIYFMITSIPSINFEIKNQKRIMLFFVIVSWIWLLSGVTVILFIIVLYFAVLNQELSIFYYMIFAGFSGSIWSVGLTEIYHFYSYTKYGKDFLLRFDWSKKGSRIDWYKSESFKKNLFIWIRNFIFIVFFWIVIMFTIAIVL